ncbi:MAG: hypothetical protein ABIR78_08335 [Ferruginibacter sp.]
MNKIVFISFLFFVSNTLKSQDAQYSKTNDGNLKLNDTLKFRWFKLTDAERKQYEHPRVNWDSIKKVMPQSLNVAENNAFDANTPPVILPSPNSASLLNLISDNVDLYTGKTSVNLPLYDLRCGSLSLPIALQSNVNAHKVNDIGSTVGLGMNLNAGGVITRVMKNLPDEFTGTICPAFNIPGWGYLQLKGNGQGIDLANFDNYSTQTKMDIIVRGNWNQKNSIPGRGWDVQPDEFYFNFGNYSGKFVFDQDGGINLIPQSNIKITTLFQVINGVNKITGFTVLTDGGVKYEFGNLPGGNYSLAPVEESKLTVNTSSIQYSYRAIAFDPWSGYYLLNGGIPLQIPVTNDYAYEREPYLIGAVPGYYGNLPGNPSEACCLSNFDQAQNNDNTEYFSYPSSWMLTKITSATGDVINFIYSAATNLSYLADRSFSSSLPDLAEEQLPASWGGDVVFASPVQPVWDGFRGIYTLPSRQNFTITKSTVDLTSKKLISINTSENTVVNFNNITPREDLLNDKRLDNIVIINSNNTTVKKINFNYDIVNTSVAELPDEQFKFFYHKTRYWYTSTIPANYIGMHSNFVVRNFQYAFGEETRGGANSSWAVPAAYRKRMFLTSVQEEANGVMMPAYGFSYNNTTKLPFRTSVDQDYFGFANSNPSKHPFIGLASTSYLNYEYRNPHINPPTKSAPAYFPGVPNSPNSILFFKTLNSGSNWTNPLYGGTKNYNPAAMQAGVLNKITYPTGGYKEFLFEFNGNPSAWNGLRVNQVKEYESPAAAPIIKNYTYGTFINTDAPALNFSLYETAFSYNGSWYFPTDREFFSGSRINPEAVTSGSAGGYSFAEISQPNNGKTRYEFFTASDFADAGTTTYIVSDLTSIPVFPVNYPYPFPPKTSYDWKRGMPKKTITYNETGLPLQYDEYMYPADIQFNGIKLIPSFSVTRYPVSILGTILTWNQRLFGKNYYISTWNPPIKTISRIYDQNGTNYAESTREFEYRKYTYNSKDYLLPFREKDLKNSRNEQTISYSKYPFDYNSANLNDPFLAGIENLKTKHVFSAKIEQFSYKQDQSGNNKKYIGALLNKYHSDKPLTKEIFKLKTNGLLNPFVESNTNNGWFNFDSHYNSEANFPLYDANGRILEQHKTNDIKEAYIWDYNKTYPVAKAINANNNEIAFSGFEADEAGANMTINPADIINDPAGAFTGKKYYSLRYPGAWFPQEPITINLNSPGKEYKLSFWHKEPVLNYTPIIVHYYNGNVETITPFVTTIKTRNGWKYSEYIVPASFTGTLTIIKGYSSPPVYIDEVRFYPVNSQMNTYSFDPLIGMTSETDVNGKTVYYEYDDLNRLAFVKNEDKDIVKTICYNYANLVVPCALNTATCTAPEINSVTRTGFNATLAFTASSNSTSCTITVHDINDDIYWLLPPGCNSPRTFNVPNKFHQYSVMVKSFAPACPLGIESLWVNF